MIFRAKAPRNFGRRRELDSMPLSIIKREAEAIETLLASHSQARRGIQPAAQKANGFGSLSHARY
jgi:hypothetical protein